MYAAAGGASLASRQARQKQRQQKQKAQKATAGLTPKPPQANQFHNYTDPAVPRLSRVERGTLKPPTQAERRHSTSNYHKELHHAKARIRESPSICIPVQPTHASSHASTHHLPQLPLSPTTLVQQNHVPNQSTYSLQSQLPQIFVPEDGKLERRCSFVRQVEEVGKKEEDVLDRCNHICNFEIKDKQWEANTQYYSDYEREVFGSLEYPFSECSQGRTAWQERERGRRCSLSEEARQHRIKQTEAHHRWMKRNRIHDTTYGGGSDEDDDYVAFHQSAAANALLYVGLGTTAIGSVIFFVGTGEKGFKTLELRLIGPTLIVAGLLCCLVRVLLCACPSPCFKSRTKTRLKDNACPHSNSRRRLAHRYPDVPDQVDFVPADKTALLHKHTRKKVSIVPPNYSLPSTSTSEFKELPSFTRENELRKLSIPQIHLPSLPDSEEHSRLSRDDSIVDLATMDLGYDIQSVSSNEESEGLTVIEQKETENAATAQKSAATKLTRPREPVCAGGPCSGASKSSDNSVHSSGKTKTETLTVETLSVVIERNDNSDNSNTTSDSSPVGKGPSNTELASKSERKAPSDKHSGIVLSPLQLGQ